jgi:hypothetical protein
VNLGSRPWPIASVQAPPMSDVPSVLACTYEPFGRPTLHLPALTSGCCPRTSQTTIRTTRTSAWCPGACGSGQAYLPSVRASGRLVSPDLYTCDGCGRALDPHDQRWMVGAEGRGYCSPCWQALPTQPLRPRPLPLVPRRRGRTPPGGRRRVGMGHGRMARHSSPHEAARGVVCRGRPSWSCVV